MNRTRRRGCPLGTGFLFVLREFDPGRAPGVGMPDRSGFVRVVIAGNHEDGNRKAREKPEDASGIVGLNLAIVEQVARDEHKLHPARLGSQPLAYAFEGLISGLAQPAGRLVREARETGQQMDIGQVQKANHRDPFLKRTDRV